MNILVKIDNDVNLLKRFWSAIKSRKSSLFCFFLLLAIIVAVYVGSLFLLSEKIATIDLTERSKPPSAAHFLGTDPFGRDMLSQLVIGARNSFTIAFALMLLTNIGGTLFGVLSGFFGGIFDRVAMRVLDFFAMLPKMMLIIVVVSVLQGNSMMTFILVMSSLGWMYDARIIRAKTLQICALDYIQAAPTLGTSKLKCMIWHVYPNLLPTIIVNATLNLAGNIGIETGLSFLGFGLPFDTPSLGTLLSYSRTLENLQHRFWMWLPATLLVLIVMLCIHTGGQSLRQALNKEI